jgi:hypothetical protein
MMLRTLVDFNHCSGDGSDYGHADGNGSSDENHNWSWKSRTDDDFNYDEWGVTDKDTGSGYSYSLDETDTL